MSRGRPRHQSSRRRMYSGRQREVRERRVQAPLEERSAPDGGTMFEIDETRDYDAPTAWGAPLHRRASAA
ncbi:MAG: hypothetical protein ABIQ05_09110 [Candidatus Limnocylindria bacterium]